MWEKEGGSKKYKLVRCRTCNRAKILLNKEHGPVCHDMHMRKEFELAYRPVAALIEGRWCVSNIDLVEPKKKDYPTPKDMKNYKCRYPKALDSYRRRKMMILNAVIPSLIDSPEEIDLDSAKSLFQMKIYQVSRDSFEPTTLPMGRANVNRERTYLDVMNEARAFVFSQDFEDICNYISLNPEVLRTALIQKWAKKEPAFLDPEDEISTDDSDDGFCPYDPPESTESLEDHVEDSSIYLEQAV
jgi:hypothetical protein